MTQTFTVKELRDRLQRFDDDSPIVIRRFDEDGTLDLVLVPEDDDSVHLVGMSNLVAIDCKFADDEDELPLGMTLKKAPS